MTMATETFCPTGECIWDNIGGKRVEWCGPCGEHMSRTVTLEEVRAAMPPPPSHELVPQHTCQYGGGDVCVECLLDEDRVLESEPAPVTDALANKMRREVEIHVDMAGEDELSNDILALLADLARYQEALRRWDDHLEGCSGMPACICGFAEARALLGEAHDDRP